MGQEQEKRYRFGKATYQEPMENQPYHSLCFEKGVAWMEWEDHGDDLIYIKEVRSSVKGGGQAILSTFVDKVGPEGNFWASCVNRATVQSLVNKGLIQEVEQNKSEISFDWHDWMMELVVPKMIVKAGLKVDKLKLSYDYLSEEESLLRDEKDNRYRVLVRLFGRT